MTRCDGGINQRMDYIEQLEEEIKVKKSKS